MNQNRKLAQLLFKDNFMFGAVMVHEEICRDFLELAVGFPIEKVEISKEKSMIYHPEYRGIRLDIIARDENRTHYNVEMQVAKKSHLGKRARYYHSQMDKGWYRSPVPGWITEEGKAQRAAIPAGLIAEIKITFTDTTTAVIPTDETWQAAESRIRFSEIYDGEVYDASFEV